MYYNCIITQFNHSQFKSYRVTLYDKMLRRAIEGDKDYLLPARVKSKTENGAKLKVLSADDDERNYKHEALMRARREIHSIIRNNYTSNIKFLTLTYASDVLDKLQVERDIKDMCRRYKDVYGHSIKYIAVLELHKRKKSYHVHMLAEMEYVECKVFATVFWKKGFCYMQAVKAKKGKSQIRCVIAYICKYLSKSWSTEVDYEHSYLISKGWNRKVKKDYVVVRSLQYAMNMLLVDMPECKAEQEIFKFSITSDLNIEIGDLFS